MKKLLLSFVSAVMIGVTCFAPLSVSANDVIQNFNGEPYLYDFDFIGTDSTGANTGFNEVIPSNKKFSTVKITNTVPLVKNNYIDLYVVIKCENINVSNLVVKSANDIVIDSYSIDTENNLIFINVNDFKVTSSAPYYTVFQFTKVSKLETAEASFKVIKFDLWQANSIEELDELQKRPMEDFLVNTGDIVTDCIEWVVSVCNTIMEAPLLLLTTGMLCLGACIGLFGRFLNKD